MRVSCARRRWSWALLAGSFAVVLLVGGLSGCSRRPAREPARALARSTWAAALAVDHQRADERWAAGDYAGARRVLEAARERLLPGSETPIGPAHADRIVLEDLQDRLARIALAAHDPRRALVEAERGLAFASGRVGVTDERPSLARGVDAGADDVADAAWETSSLPADVFVGNLLVARGAAYEALGRDRAAAMAYEEAMAVREKLLEGVRR